MKFIYSPRYGLKIAVLVLVFLQHSVLYAAIHQIHPEKTDLQMIIDQALPGDRIIFSKGVHYVNLFINKPLTLEGEAGAILDGGNKGDVLRVRAANVIIRGLQIQNSGHNLTEMNAGIFAERTAENILIEKNTLEANGFGVWLGSTTGARVLNNRIHGVPEQRSQDRGNGIHLSGNKNSLIKGNKVWETRDGIYIESSHENTLQDNVLHDLRYGIHYMYAHSNQIIGNRTFRTRTGYALMQSNHLTVINNSSEEDRNYGILLNFITYSKVANNSIKNVKVGAAYATGGASILGADGKAIFIYNSQFNDIHDNQFSSCDIGIHLTAGSEDNKIYGNTFMANKVQVKYVATRPQDWSLDGRGNYWSDYLGWDLNADGIGDKQYEPNDAVDKLLWKYPVARILMNSPAVETLRWVQDQFPILKPQGVRDSAPLMVSPYPKEANI